MRNLNLNNCDARYNQNFFLKPKLTEKIRASDVPLISISEELKSKLKLLGSKSISIREIDVGSTNDCEHEIAALENPIYDIKRFGIRTVASPRHADIV